LKNIFFFTLLIKKGIFSGFNKVPETDLEGRRGQNGAQSLQQEFAFTKKGKGAVTIFLL